MINTVNQSKPAGDFNVDLLILIVDASEFAKGTMFDSKLMIYSIIFDHFRGTNL